MFKPVDIMDCVGVWRSRLRPSTAKVGLRYLSRFEKFVAESGGDFKDYSLDELVEYQLSATGQDRFRVLDLVEQWVLTLTGRAGYKRTAYSYLRSFFMHNRADLPIDRGFKVRGDTPKVQGLLTVEDLRQVVLSCNPLFQAVFLAMFQAGMGSDEFLYWNLNGLQGLKKQLEEGAIIVKLDLPGRKKLKYERPYYTFLSGDALAALRRWLSLRQVAGKAIFVNQHGRPLRRNSLWSYWIRHLRKLGLVDPVREGDTSHRTGRNLHELRDLFRSQWAKSDAKPMVGEFVMGHPIDVNEYDKSFRDVDLYRREYLKALPYLQIMSSPRPFKLISEESVDELQRELRKERVFREELTKAVVELQNELYRLKKRAELEGKQVEG